MAGSYRERNSTSDRTLDILNLFTDDRPRLTAGELAAQLGTARSTAYRYLETLTSAGFVEEDPAGGFRLGMRIFELARVARRSYGFDGIVGPILESLAQETGETALLTRRHGSSVVCLDRREAADRLVRISYERGAVFTANAGASALVLFAWDEPSELAALLESAELPRYTASTPARPKEITAILAEVRAQGFLVSRGTLDPDALGVAAPVRDDSGTVIAAVSVVALASRVDARGTDALVDAVLRAAETASSQLALVAN